MDQTNTFYMWETLGALSLLYKKPEKRQKGFVKQGEAVSEKQHRNAVESTSQPHSGASKQ